MRGNYFDRQSGQGDLRRLVRDRSERREDAGKPSRVPRAPSPYEPTPLCSHEFFFSAETISAVSQAEIAIAKTDCLLGASPYRRALTRALARLEGSASVRTNGVKPDYRVCCYLDIQDFERETDELARTQHKRIAQLAKVSEECAEASLFAHRIERAVLHLLATLAPGTPITPKMIIDLSRRIAGSEKEGLRTWDYRRRNANIDPSTYLPPSPARLPGLLQDITDFCNKPAYSPLTRSAIIHYQLEALKAFSDNLDQLGRLCAIALWKSSGLIEHVMPPFSLTPAMVTMRHTSRLEAYRDSDHFKRLGEEPIIDDWIYHSARGCELSATVAMRFHRELTNILNNWVASLEANGTNVTRTMRRFMEESLGQPVFTLSYMESSVGCSPSTASSIASTLVSQGILSLGVERKRNRVYEAAEVLSLFSRIESTVLPSSPPSREQFIDYHHS